MEACNSHKCHCLRCITMREQDQKRRDAWKRLARQHHVDQAGVCCAPHEVCTCPNCIETREFYTIRPGERIAKIRTMFDEDGFQINWVWVRLPHGWRRKNIATQKFFGDTVWRTNHYPKRATGEIVHHIRTRTAGAASIKDEVIIHTTNPNSADNWVQQTFTDPPAYMSLEQATKFYRLHYGLDSPWTDPPRKTTFPDWPQQAKEVPMLTALQLAILAHCNVHPGVPYPYTCPGVNVSQALADLVTLEFLTDTLGRGYELTGRAVVFLRAINTLPLPVRKPAPWTMPS